MKRHFKQFFKEKFKANTIIIICVYLMVPFMLAVMIRTSGTPGPDCQLTNGTVNPDHIIQQSFGDNDLQGALGQPGNDTIIQDGGTEDDLQLAAGGEGADYILQRGKDGDDLQYAEGDDGNDRLSQIGGEGNDGMFAFGCAGNERILQNGGNGDDLMVTWGGEGNDHVTILAGDDTGEATDYIIYVCSPGKDQVLVDGGPGHDILYYVDCYGEINPRTRQSSVGSSNFVNGCNGVFIFGDTTVIVRRVEECDTYDEL